MQESNNIEAMKPGAFNGGSKTTGGIVAKNNCETVVNCLDDTVQLPSNLDGDIVATPKQGEKRVAEEAEGPSKRRKVSISLNAGLCVGLEPKEESLAPSKPLNLPRFLGRDRYEQVAISLTNLKKTYAISELYDIICTCDEYSMYEDDVVKLKAVLPTPKESREMLDASKNGANLSHLSAEEDLLLWLSSSQMLLERVQLIEYKTTLDELLSVLDSNVELLFAALRPVIQQDEWKALLSYVSKLVKMKETSFRVEHLGRLKNIWVGKKRPILSVLAEFIKYDTKTRDAIVGQAPYLAQAAHVDLLHLLDSFEEMKRLPGVWARLLVCICNETGQSNPRLQHFIASATLSIENFLSKYQKMEALIDSLIDLVSDGVERVTVREVLTSLSRFASDLSAEVA